MLAAGRGDRDAFGILVQRHQRAIVQFAHRFLATADRATAEDLAQQAFLGAWRYAQTFQPRAKVLTWLFRIATNACLNYRRYEDARPKVAPDEAAEQPADDSADISDVEDRTRRLRAALAALAPQPAGGDRAEALSRILVRGDRRDYADLRGGGRCAAAPRQARPAHCPGR